MSAVDPGRTARGKEAALPSHRWWILRAFFLVALCTVLYLALMPNHGRPRFLVVPLPVYRWISEQDNFDNIVAFAVLAVAAFLLGRHPAGRENGGFRSAFARRFGSRPARLASLLAMVCVFEILQIWIPGRVSSLEDVCTGWSGIFAAWLLCEVRDARKKTSSSRPD